MIGLGLDGYEPDSGHESAIAFRIRVVEAEQYIPAHSHRKGQLILALHGALTCEVENAMWMVPPQYAVWVPGQLSHSNRATPGAQVCFLFIEPGAAPMPDRCCTLKISPLVRELILALAERGGESLAAPATARLVQVLFDELPRQPQEHLQLPVSNHPKIRQMVTMMAEDPARWQTLNQWAAEFAMSERNLARLVVRETGLSFRRWRHQLQLILALQQLIRGQTVQQTAQALGYDFPINSEMIPAAISGPTGTPRNRATPSTVPTNSPATRCGWEPISETPRPPSHETNTPTAIASSDFQFIKEWISVDGGSVPLAMGAITPIVRMMIPTVRPCFSIQGKKAFSGVTRTIISTRMEIATVVL